MRAFLREMICAPNGRVSARRFIAVALIPALYVGVLLPSVTTDKMYTISALISVLLVTSTIEKFNKQTPPTNETD